MSSFPLLFELATGNPTTRSVADLVKKGGVASLPDAHLRADQARYQEVTCRSALNRVRGMPFKWTLNPYRGCTHACHYCFARQYHAQFELNTGDDFSSMILVKRNVAAVLARELDRPSWHREHVALGTATDPYQPIEGHYTLTRQIITALGRGRTPMGLVTKGPMVVRDIDVLSEHAQRATSTVYMSVPTVDEDAWRSLEPGTAHPQQRLRAVRELVDAGINAGVLMAPLVPGFSTSRAKVERTIKAIAESGARFMGYNVMHLEQGTRTHFMTFVEREFPAMRPRLDRLYRTKHPPEKYRKDVQGMVRALQSRYGLHTQARADGTTAKAEDTAPEQVGFAWS